MAPTPRPHADLDLASSLQWVAVGLLLVFVATELKQLLPPAVLDPVWELRAGEALRGTSALPLLAGVLLLLAQRFDPGDAGLGRRVLRLRRLAIAASLGFLLLIPLQISAGLRQINLTSAVEARQLNAVRQVAAAIRQAGDAEAMNRAIARLPGLPADFQGQYAKPIEQVRAGLLEQIQPQIRRLELRLAEVRQQRLLGAGGLFVFDGLMALAYGIGFAAIASTGREQPNLLLQMLWQLERLRNWIFRRREPQKAKGPISEDWIQSLLGEDE